MVKKLTLCVFFYQNPYRRPISLQDVETLRERLFPASDPRNVLAARDSLKQLLGLRLLDP